MEFRDTNPTGDPIGKALENIEGIRGEIMGMGANDSENDRINVITRRLKAGEYPDPSEAIKEVEAIRDSKNADH